MKLLKFISVLVLAGCSALTTFSPAPVVPAPRPLPFLPGSSFDSDITNGLSNADREAFYHFDYGIQYLPTNVFLALKRANNDQIPRIMDELFFAHPERFGLLPDYINPNNPLPIGITQSTDTDYVPMTGINCSSCHLSMIENSNHKFFLIDGASSRFQIDVFLGETLKSVIATLINPVEFEAFFERYQLWSGLSASSENFDPQPLSVNVKAAYINNDLTKLPAVQTTQSGRKTTLTTAAYPTNKELSTRTGMYAYLVHRFAYLFSLAKYGSNPEGSNVANSGPGRSNPWMPTKQMLADLYLHSNIKYQVVGGPINTPFMWDTNRQHWIFLLGNTNSMLERHLAQGLALLSDFNPQTFETTLSIKKINAISQYVNRLQAPTWPVDILGPINQDLATRGKTIFEAKCYGCHNSQPQSQSIASANYDYVDVGTDPNYYNGQIEKLDEKDLFSDVIAPFMTRVKTTTANNEGITNLLPYEQGRLPVVWKAPTANEIIAKPLMGVFATGPFLHNGSVPTIRDLLKPDFMRPKQFSIGTFVYDTKNLGYIDDLSAPNIFIFDTNLVGNSNKGHNYGIDLSDDDKNALLEFLKAY